MSLLQRDIRLPEPCIHDFGRDLAIAMQARNPRSNLELYASPQLLFSVEKSVGRGDGALVNTMTGFESDVFASIQQPPECLEKDLSQYDEGTSFQDFR